MATFQNALYVSLHRSHCIASHVQSPHLITNTVFQGNCLAAQLNDPTTCSDGDVTCICARSSMLNDFPGCVAAACEAADYNTTMSSMFGTCLKEGVTLKLPAESLASSTRTIASTKSSTSTPSPVVSPGATSAISSPVGGEAADSTSSSKSNDSNSSSRSGVSPGVAAGIGVGVTALIVLLALGGFIYYRRRSKAKKSNLVADTGMSGGTDKIFTTVPDESWKGRNVLHEVDGVPRSEVLDMHGVGVAIERRGMVEAGG
jgi:hypothetical protein